MEQTLETKRQDRGIVRGLVGHIIDSTAILAEATPIYAASETIVSGMSYDNSLNSRILSAYLTVGGLGLLYGKGRDLWRRVRKITDKSTEKVQQVNDIIYTGIFNLLCMPGIYLASGVTDPKEVAIGTATAVAVGGLNGMPLGYAVDAFRDLTGFQKSERVPAVIRDMNPTAKKGLAALLVAGSLGLTSAIYKTFT